MLHLLFWRRLGIAVSFVLLVTMSLLSTMLPQAAFAKSNSNSNHTQPSVSAQSINVAVSSDVVWQDTGISLNVGDSLKISATGSWSADPGDGFTSPDGYTQQIADNFLNLTDLGACSTCASTPTPHWGALIGYIGNNPPAAGSYTSTSILPEAQKVFLVGSSFGLSVARAGELWLNFNDDAYSANTGDNAGQVSASVTDTPSSKPLGGKWISPASGFTITGNILHFAAHAFGGAGVSKVNFTALWSGVNPKIWAIPCTVTSPTPGTTDVYECDWTSSAALPNGSLRMNLAGVPRGPVRVSFDVYDKAGHRVLAPDGTRQITMRTGWGTPLNFPIGVRDKSGLRQPTGWSIEQDFNVSNGFFQVCATLRQPDGSPDCYHSGEDWQKEVNGVRSGNATAGQSVYPIAPGKLTWIHTTGTYPGDVIMLEHQTPRGLIYSMYAHVLPSADLLKAWQQGKHPVISSTDTVIATIIKWPGDITNSHLHFEIRGFFKDNDVINNGVFNCGCEVGPGYWLWSRGGPEAKGWLRPSLVIMDSRH